MFRRLLLAAIVASPALLAAGSHIPLGGTWEFQLDPQKTGHAERWFERQLGPDTIFLPGSTDQSGYGTKVTTPEKGYLTRPYKYEGLAWYQKEVVIPGAWRAKHITLYLERAHWSTEVWVDGKAFGSENSLTTPHEYDLSDALTPGRHRITICVDNDYLVDIGRDGHSFGEHTQTNWNGIVGAIELRATAPVWIDSVAVYPAEPGMLRAEVELRNRTRSAVGADLTADVPGLSHTSEHAVVSGAQKIEMRIPVKSAKLWDEYEPNLYSLDLRLTSRAGADTVSTTIGVRDIAARGTQFLLNGRPVFLRGTLECAIFPKTGYPSTNVDDWARMFRIARSYGLNAFRFHSWCPPEAAFIAADRAGFLLHVELPVWSSKVGKDARLDDYMRTEGYRILKAYGNHPSFTMMCLGNELTGDDVFMDNLVAEFKKADPRRLYTFSADHRRRSPGTTSDYWVTQQTSVGRLRVNGGRFTGTMDGTDHDYSDSVKAFHLPLVTHEMGQWAVYPSYGEIAKYNGVLKARNLEVFRGQLESRGMLDEAEWFQLASGRFSWSIYKEEIEATLRTPDYGGFFLLQLEDFPGQGEALVGLLDSFWDSKGILTPEEFRRFCGETVPLLRMKKFVWTNEETYSAQAEVAHYGKQPVANAAAEWSATDDNGRVRFSGSFPAKTLAVGSVTPLGEIAIPLGAVETATHLKVTMRVRGTDARNDWDIWVYPARVDTTRGEVLVTTAFDAAAQQALAAGRTVLLTVPKGRKGDHLFPTRFLPVFWSDGWFAKTQGTLGILCDPAQPALARFPTSFHSQWQWWELSEGASAFVLDDLPPGYRPLVQVIDDLHRNHELGAVIEALVGKGKLLATSFDLTTGMEERPVARQMLHSLLEYARGSEFHPQQAIPMSEITRLLQ
jgi:hypothetical protein